MSSTTTEEVNQEIVDWLKNIFGQNFSLPKEAKDILSAEKATLEDFMAIGDYKNEETSSARLEKLGFGFIKTARILSEMKKLKEEKKKDREPSELNRGMSMQDIQHSPGLSAAAVDLDTAAHFFSNQDNLQTLSKLDMAINLGQKAAKLKEFKGSNTQRERLQSDINLLVKRLHQECFELPNESTLIGIPCVDETNPLNSTDSKSKNYIGNNSGLQYAIDLARQSFYKLYKRPAPATNLDEPASYYISKSNK